MQKLFSPTWLEINLDAIRENVKQIKRLIGKNVELMAVVKGNAYGHDLIEVAKITLDYGANSLAVARFEEGMLLRKAGINAPILILSLNLNELCEEIVLYDLTSTVVNLEMVKELSFMAFKHQKTSKVHLKVETGMNRIGLFPPQVLDFIKRVKNLKNIQIEGIFTHFSVADERDKSYTLNQFHKFNEVLKELEREKINIPIKHVGNSATILDLPQMWLDMVRPGISIYGLYPSQDIKKIIPLIPAQTFKTKIIYLKELSGGESISYGRTYTTKGETIVATLPVGYADGYNRLLSNRGEVLVKGKRAPVIGRVCMDHTMIDVTNIPGVEVGDEVILWGKQKNAEITVEEVAQYLNTINYEVLHLPDKDRVPKLFIKNGQPWKIKSRYGEYLL
ncbi:MAG: alanine racemase [Candidatus Caldatribacteriota bacterium]